MTPSVGRRSLLRACPYSTFIDGCGINIGSNVSFFCSLVAFVSNPIWCSTTTLLGPNLKSKHFWVQWCSKWFLSCLLSHCLYFKHIYLKISTGGYTALLPPGQVCLSVYHSANKWTNTSGFFHWGLDKTLPSLSTSGEFLLLSNQTGLQSGRPNNKIQKSL